MGGVVYSLLQTTNKVKEVVPQEDGQYLECSLACIETFSYNFCVLVMPSKRTKI
jgi:hypothetical protein